MNSPESINRCKKIFFLCLTLCCAIFGTLGCRQDEAAKKLEIIIVQNNWGSAQINAQIAKQLIESELGYTVALVSLDENAQWAEIARGDAHISLEIWPSAHIDNYIEFVEKQQSVSDAGKLGPVGRIGWYVPGYVIDKYPQVATWQGLQQAEVAAYFATAETAPYGQLLGPRRQDHTFEESIIHNLELPFEVIYAGSEAGILAGVEAAIDRQGAIMFYLWTPHVIHAEYDLVEVKLPDYYPGCHADPAVVDCGYPDEVLYKIVWSKLAAEAPEIDAFIRKMHLELSDQIAMLAEIKRDEVTAEVAAGHWIEANESKWKSWLPQTLPDNHR